MPTGLPKHSGPKTAIVIHLGYGQKLNHVAVLDLNSTYDRVPRALLMKKVNWRLTDNTANMISTILLPMSIKTGGDATKPIGWISRGVPQGSPVSPCLFNLFMNGYAERLSKGMRQCKIPEQDWMLTMFADDVKINANEPQTLQNQLALSERWSTSNDMSWSTSNCTVLTRQRRRHERTIHTIQKNHLNGETDKVAWIRNNQQRSEGTRQDGETEEGKTTTLHAETSRNILEKHGVTDAPKHMRHIRNVEGNVRETHDPTKPGTGPNRGKTGERHHHIHIGNLLRSKKKQAERHRLDQHTTKKKKIEVEKP